VVSGGQGDLAVGILVENGTIPGQPVIGSAGAGNIIRGAALSVPNDAIGIWCINAVPAIQNNDLITGDTATNEAIGIFLDDCDNGIVSNNTRIEGGITTNPVAGASWSVGIRADFSTGVTISNNPMITGGGSFESTGILLFSSIATISGNTVNAGAGRVNEGIVFSGSGGTVRNNIIDANGAGGIDAYGIRMFGCSNPAMGPAGGNTFQGASGIGRHLWDGNIPNVGSPLPCGVSPYTVNASGNTWSEAPPPAGLQCGAANDSLLVFGTRNYNILNAGQCVQF
jgi:parallel beta-helix repeat protein